MRYRSSLFQLFFINIKINSSPNYCLFVCLVYILFICLFTFFIPMLSWCLKLEQSRRTQWTVGVPKLGHKPLVKWEGGGSNRVAMGQDGVVMGQVRILTDWPDDWLTWWLIDLTTDFDNWLIFYNFLWIFHGPIFDNRWCWWLLFSLANILLSKPSQLSVCIMKWLIVYKIEH